MIYSIIVDLSERQLYLLQDGKFIKAYLIGVGKLFTPTPTGNYYVVSKVPNPGGPFGAMWMGLSQPHYGIHGTNNPNSVGQQVSHGCIRMYNAEVLQLAHLISLQTPVIIRV